MEKIEVTASGESAIAVKGIATGPHSVGASGEGEGAGLVGKCINGWAVNGESVSGIGARGVSNTGWGIDGESESGVGVRGTSKNGTGVLGESKKDRGVHGSSETSQGVYGHSNTKAGVVGESDQFDGVYGISHNRDHAGISGHNPGGLAGYFDGDVVVTGDIRLINADCAEDFNIADADSIEPGTVMVLGNDESLHQSSQSYDKRVAGVVSGAGKYKPGIVLDKQEANANRKPIALLGKVYCKVDAQYAAIEVGDLLTTSPSAGHAMKASDHMKSFGAVIGKALRPFKNGKGLIPILIALQ